MAAPLLIVTNSGTPLEVVTAPCPPVVISNNQPPVEILISGSGPAGPQGIQGPIGPTGPSGGNYYHQQMVPSSTWTIVHSLGYRPAVTTFDTQNDEIEGEVVHTDVNTVVVNFSVSVGGTAVLS